MINISANTKSMLDNFNIDYDKLCELAYLRQAYFSTSLLQKYLIQNKIILNRNVPSIIYLHKINEMNYCYITIPPINELNIIIEQNDSINVITLGYHQKQLRGDKENNTYEFFEKESKTYEISNAPINSFMLNLKF